jgi:hypothetical protein
MSNGITDVLETMAANSELLKGFSTAISAEGLSMAGDAAGGLGKTGKMAAYKFGSILVEPAVWMATGKIPGVVDALLWGIGSAATAAGQKVISGASFSTSIAKAVIENQSNKKLQEAMRSEPDLNKARYMDLCSNFHSGLYSAQTNALMVAQAGGVAWQHSNGFWVYIKDAKGALVCNYLPNNFSKLYCPYLPLTPDAKGRMEVEIY